MIAGIIVVFGVIKMFTAILGNKVAYDRIGVYINLFVYAIAVFFPFTHGVGVVIFGLGALYMLSLNFDTGYFKRVAATLASFVLLAGVRFGVNYIIQNDNMQTAYILSALIFFVFASLIHDISRLHEKKKNAEYVQGIKNEAENEKNELTSTHINEVNLLKNKTVSQLKHILYLLDLFKIEAAEASVKNLSHLVSRWPDGLNESPAKDETADKKDSGVKN